MHVCISTMQFEGAGGFVRSGGTTLEQAANNQIICQAITSERDVVMCYNTIVLEDKSSQVVLNKTRAAEHMRGCINNIKASTKKLLQWRSVFKGIN